MASNNIKTGKPIQILKLSESTGKLVLDNEQLEDIFLDREIENVNLSVVSIAGAFRKGKSFLLSFFVRFLEFYYDNDSSELKNYTEWLNDKNSSVRKFDWCGGCKRHTTGIWIWSKIFTKTMPNNQRIGIVLMDTQGMFDNESDMNCNVMIFAFSTMLSSIQIYNLFNQIQEDHLQHLQLFTEYGRIAMENSESKPFQQILFLIRDWCFVNDYAYGLLGGSRFLKERVLKIKSESPAGITAVRKHLELYFDETSCFLMPDPGDVVRKKQNFDGRLSDIDAEFVRHLNDLICYLLKPENIIRSGLKQVHGAKIKPRDFCNLIQQYWNVFKSGKIPEAKNILEAIADAICLSARSDLMQDYFRTMSRLSQSSDIDVPQLLNIHRNLLGDAMQKFDVRVVMGDKQSRERHRQELKNLLQDYVTYFLGELQSRTTKSLNETIAKLSAEINALKIRTKENPVELVLVVQNQLQEFMKISQEQQMERIDRMEKMIMKTMRQEKPVSQLEQRRDCNIM